MPRGKIRIGCIAVVGGCVLAAAVCVPRAGRFLVVADPFDQAEVALVLSGLPTSRAFAARDLYQQGRVREILVVPEPPNKVEGELVQEQLVKALAELGLLEPSLPQWAQRILVASGVPESKLVVLPEHSFGTIVEARRVRAFLHDRLPASLVLVTSPSHSRRARMIYRHVFKQDPVQLFSYPTPYDAFVPDAWWSQPRNALTVVTEYQKLIANALTLALRPRGD